MEYKRYTDWQPHVVKKNIIQHSIYGVDIESGAVDIARLRFWLALVVDEVEPLPLPNLDYKIMQGNSLLESFEGIDLSQISDAAAYEAVYESEQIELFSGEAKKKVRMSLQFEDVKTLMDDYFNANDPRNQKGFAQTRSMSRYSTTFVLPWQSIKESFKRKSKN